MSITRIIAAPAILSSLVVAAGCSSDGNADPLLSDKSQQQRLVAEAAQADYPSTQMGAGEESDVVAIVQGDQILMSNLGDERYDDVSVWVNKGFVRSVSTLPARGQVPISLGSFYDASGVALTQFKVDVNDVAFVAGDDETLYDTVGVVKLGE